MRVSKKEVVEWLTNTREDLNSAAPNSAEFHFQLGQLWLLNQFFGHWVDLTEKEEKLLYPNLKED